MSTIAVRSRGEAVKLARDAIAGPGKFRLLLLKAAQTEELLQDHATIGAMLGTAGNTESDATNYARKQLAPAVTTDYDTNEQYVTFPSVTFTSLGGAVNNSIVKVVVYYDPTGASADSACIPIGYWTTSLVTSGVNLVIASPTDGFVAGT